MFFSDAPPSGTAAPAGARIAVYAGPRRRILVTDDDPAHLAMVRNVLAPPGLALVFADNGAACLAVCRAQLPDLVLPDIPMPGPVGWVTARAIRAEHGDDRLEEHTSEFPSLMRMSHAVF